LPVKSGVGDGATIEYDVSKGGTLVLQFLPDYPLWPGLKYGVDVSFDCGEPRYVPVPMLDHVPCVKVSNRKRAMMDQYVRSEIEIPSNAKVVKISANGPGVVIDCVGIRTKEREPKKVSAQRKIIKMNY
jgi:hypothetical protein